MSKVWRRSVEACDRTVRHNQGTKLAVVVSGSNSEQRFWREWMRSTREDVFRQDGATLVVSSLEETRKGNFLGTLKGWSETRESLSDLESLPSVAVMSMVFGKGTRLSPFTQALGNRKPAFPTPRRSSAHGAPLRTADIANLSSANLVRHLQASGFEGLVVKWGDEAMFPGVDWDPGEQRYDNVDAIRFVWNTQPSPRLASEKEWVVADPKTGLMEYQYARQRIDLLRSRMASNNQLDYSTGVNLGSLAISYEFLDIARRVLTHDIRDPEKWVDWDPYVWIALFCKTEQEWQSEIEHEQVTGQPGIKKLQERYPDFYQRIRTVRKELEASKSRSMRVAVLDFGDPFWVDWGLHDRLRQSLDALTADTDEGFATRELFSVPHERDENNNIVVRSRFPQGATIRNSLLVDTIIADPDTLVRNGVLVGGRHRRISMPEGGAALFCASDDMVFNGPRAVALRSVGHTIELREGERHTTLCLQDGLKDLRTNEDIRDYTGSNYCEPILGNRLSFERATSLVAQQDTSSLEQCWNRIWKAWLD